MFSLPIPTDSLYKFLFVSGLILIIFSAIYSNKAIDVLLEGILKEDFADKQVRFHTDKNNFTLLPNGFSIETGEVRRRNFTGDSALRSQMIIKRGGALPGLSVSNEFEKSSLTLNILVYQAENVKKITRICYVLGYLFVFVGIVLWYLKVQKPQDKLLRLQLTDAQRKGKVFGRRHFEAKTLPRPQIRNRT